MTEDQLKEIESQMAAMREEIERLRGALAPFSEAYDMASKRINTGSLSEITALAKHYVRSAPFQVAYIICNRLDKEPTHD
jgi:hypothetical protein